MSSDLLASHLKRKTTFGRILPMVLTYGTICFVLFVLFLLSPMNSGDRSRTNQKALNVNQTLLSLLNTEKRHDGLLGLIEQLSSENGHVRDASQKEILLLTGKSAQDRTEVIDELMRAVTSPDFAYKLDNSDVAASHLWASATEILSKLKAIEAIDLLIERINLIIGTEHASDNYRHMPAKRALSRMGEVAVPMLSKALYHYDPRVRNSAVWCLANIGGKRAREALTIALEVETDSEVRREIKAGIATIDRTPMDGK